MLTLIESLNNGPKLLRETHLFLEYVEEKYPIGTFDFLIDDLSTVSSSTITIATNLNILSQVFEAYKFMATLIVELVPLPTSASLAMYLTLTSCWLIWLSLFWALRWVV